MTKPMTVDEARRLIALCRDVDGKATKGPWTYNNSGDIFEPANTEPEYVARKIQFDEDGNALVLWRAGFGALLNAIENLMQHATPHPVGSIADALTPLAEWADREHQGWRTR